MAESGPMRYLGVDLGQKRTGLALGDCETRLASPAAVLETPIPPGGGDALLRDVAAAVREWLGDTPGEIVVGLPINMDGTENPATRAARAFAARLERETGRRVHLFDERLTTAAADWALARSGLTHKGKKARRDAIAAAAMLQGFLDGLARSE